MARHQRLVAGRSPRRLAAPTAALCLALALLVACASSQAQTRLPRPTATAPQDAPNPKAQVDTHLSVVSRILSRMTLDQELGQLFIVEYLYPDANHSDLQAMIGQMGAGGVILYESMNIYGVDQMRQLTQAMEHTARIPLILGADEEGGGDDQTDKIFGPHPTALQIGQTGDPRVAAQNAARIASELKQLGMNADFAPVVDVMGPDVAWTRSFSHSPAVVTQMGAAQVDAMQSAGVMACLKHFPGLGNTTVNPHHGLPVINSSRSYIEQNDLAPYRALMSHQPAMIMTTDLLMPALDPTMPAELSYPIVTGVLRNEIGYNGVVVTDALYMAGITDKYSMPEAGVLSIEAGNDMIEGPWNTDQMRAMIDALRSAVTSGRISKARIDQSVRRILLLKQRFGMLPSGPPPGIQDMGSAGVVPGAPGGASALLASDALAPDPAQA
jgi:beta-N-acetylhexosaminidase